MTKQILQESGASVHKSGVSFRVWAPFAESVAVTGTFNDWSESPMEKGEDGHWSCDIEDAVPGQEYKYIIQNGEQKLFKNDPRSLQVTTSAGNSVISEPAFDWNHTDFSLRPFNELVLYEMHIGTFNRADPSTSGTFKDAIEKLDYLSELGVNMIELMPVCSMPMDRGWGYATDYIYAVESLYGGRRGLLEFVDEAHARNIGVTLDVVYNHIGPDDSLDLWQFDGWSENNKGGIYFYNDWRAETPWGETRPDYGRPEVREYILDNVKMWLLDCKLDGLRLDSTIYLRNVKGNNDDPGNDIAEGWSLMQDITSLAKKIKPDALLVAEDIAYNEYITKQPADGGAGFSSQWEVTFPHIMRESLQTPDDNSRNLSAVTGAIVKRYNNDAFQRVIYSDSHDSAANGSSRLSEEIAPGNATSVYARRRSLVAASITLTAPGIPMLFQGQEFMQPGHFNDWQALDWEKAEQFKGIVLAHKHLVELRINENGLTKGLTGHSVNVLRQDDQNKLIAYHRWDQGGPRDDVVVIVNFANNKLNDYVSPFPRDGAWKVRFNSDWKGYADDFSDTNQADVIAADRNGSFSIAPYSVLVLSQDE